MQFYREHLLSQDRHRDYVQAAEQNRLARLAGSRQRSLQSVGKVLARLVGLFFIL